jgi:TetR/AcrR family transcriptional regulator
MKPTTAKRKSSPKVREIGRRDAEARILKAAANAFAQNGFEGATINAIAQGAGVPAANVHYYFATKEILYRRVLHDIQDIWTKPLGLFDENADPAEVLREYIRVKFISARDNPIESRVFANEILHGAPYLEGYLRTTHNQKMEPLWRVFNAWIAKGLIDPIDPKALMFTLWAATQTYADFEVQIRALTRKDVLEPVDYDAAAEQLSRIILIGIGARERGSRPRAS